MQAEKNSNIIKLDAKGQYTEAIFDAFIEADFKNQNLVEVPLKVNNKESPVEKMNSEI